MEPDDLVGAYQVSMLTLSGIVSSCQVISASASEIQVFELYHHPLPLCKDNWVLLLAGYLQPIILYYYPY
jgi:hypothetical protein